jgi:hypothetical protein
MVDKVTFSRCANGLISAHASLAPPRLIRRLYSSGGCVAPPLSHRNPSRRTFRVIKNPHQLWSSTTTKEARKINSQETAFAGQNSGWYQLQTLKEMAGCQCRHINSGKIEDQHHPCLSNHCLIQRYPRAWKPPSCGRPRRWMLPSSMFSQH